MTKKIKDYLHYYLKSDLLCRVKRKNDTEYHIGKLCEVTYKSNHGDWASFWFEDVITVTSQTWETSSANHHWFFFGEDSIIPLLRPLSSMTNKEVLTSFHLSYEDAKYQFEEFDKIETNEFGWRAKNQNGMQCFLPANSFKPDVFHYLLKQGFDLFGLTESGLAIDATTLNESK